MDIVLVGLNHRTAPVELREQMTLADCGLRMALEDLSAGRHHPRLGEKIGPDGRITETVILSTCNRLEVYAVVSSAGGEPAAGWAAVERFLAGLQGVPVNTLRPHLYHLAGHEAVVHLMRVAAGLDSMILGEPQILGQVSGAQSEAHLAGTIGPVLSHLFDQAAHAGKRARTETEIGRHTTSISHAAAQLVKDRLGELERVNVLVVGAGEMAEVAAHALQDHGARHLNFINRTYARAEDLAHRFGGRALNWYHLPAALVMADVVVTATGAPHIVVHENDVRLVLSERAGRPLLFVDIAVPRDVEAAVDQLPGVRRYDIDHFQSAVDANLVQRQAAVPGVEEIIDQEVARFETWLQGRQVLPVLVELRRKSRQIAEAELERHLQQADDLTPEYQDKVARMVYRIVNKILHEPTVRLKASAAEGNGVAYAHAISDLFALESNPTAPVPRLKSRPKPQINPKLNGTSHLRENMPSGLGEAPSVQEGNQAEAR